MRRRLPLLLVLFTIPLGGCFGPEPAPPIHAKVTVNLRPDATFRKKGVADIPTTPEQDAILAVLTAESAGYEAAVSPLNELSQPSAISKALDQYVQALDKIDPKDCPAKFRSAFSKYRKACRELFTAIKPLPDQYKESEFLDAVGSAMRGKRTEIQLLGGDVWNAAHDIGQTFDVLCDQIRLAGLEADR